MFARTLAWLLVVTLLGACHSEPVCSYYNLLQNLSLQNSSGANARPVKDWTTQSIVWVNMYLYTIVDLDTSMQTLTTLIWFTMAWDNEFVSWNPDDFCGIDKIYVYSDNFWKPDIYIDEMTQDDQSSPMIPYCLLYNNGTIVYGMPLRIVSSCYLDIYKFPFDTQTCVLSFGSYVHTVDDLIMLPSCNSTLVSETSKEIFTDRGDWTLLDISVSNLTYETEGDLYNQVIYKITIRRTPIIYIVNMIIPASLMLLLDIVSMFIHFGSEERLNFKITIILGFSVLLLVLNNILPNSGSPPVLGIFCAVCLAVMVLSIIGSIVISYMLSLSDTQSNVPSWMKTWILRHLARVLCFKTNITKEDIDTAVAVHDNHVSEPDTKAEHSKKFLEKKKITKGSLEAKLLKKLLAETVTIHQHLTDCKNENDAKSDWYMAALVVDRLVFIIYLITVCIIFTVVIVVWVT
ncbi:5-hydroxytryptamine receptor 3A-like [Discoglossus pictus]